VRKRFRLSGGRDVRAEAGGASQGYVGELRKAESWLVIGVGGSSAGLTWNLVVVTTA